MSVTSNDLLKCIQIVKKYQMANRVEENVRVFGYCVMVARTLCLGCGSKFHRVKIKETEVFRQRSCSLTCNSRRSLAKDPSHTNTASSTKSSVNVDIARKDNFGRLSPHLHSNETVRGSA